MRVGSTKAVLNRIVATRILNPRNGKSKSIYCQEDGGSQLTLISTKLVKELDLESHDSASFCKETMTREKIICDNLVNYELQLLILDEVFNLSNVVARTLWQDDVDTQPHRQDVSSYPRLRNINLLHFPNNDLVDLLIDNDNAFLMTVLEEREGDDVKDPYDIFSKIYWYVCGGIFLEKAPVKFFRIKACVDNVSDPSSKPSYCCS